MAFSFLFPKYPLSLWGFHKSPIPELLSGWSLQSDVLWKISCAKLPISLVGETMLWALTGSPYMTGWGKLVPSALCIIHSPGDPPLKPTSANAFLSSRSISENKAIGGHEVCCLSAVKGYLAKEEQWCGREHVAALVLPESSKEAILLNNFPQLINWISSLWCLL